MTSRVAAAVRRHQDGQRIMIDEVPWGADVPPLGDARDSGHAPTDATQRACAIIAALQAAGCVTTPAAVARLVYMLQRVIAVPASESDLLRGHADEGGLAEGFVP